MKAREFFRTTSDEMKFEVHLNGMWFENVTAKEMINALDTVSILEESYIVTFWNSSLTKTEYIYVTLEENHGYDTTGLQEILASMGKMDSLSIA